MRPKITQRPFVEKLKQWHDEASESMEDFQAKIKGRRAYYRDSPSSPKIKHAVAKKMGSR